MRPWRQIIFWTFPFLLILVGCLSQSSPLVTPVAVTATTAPDNDTEPASLSYVAGAFQKGGCGGCHVIPGVAGARGTVGPDLSAIGETAATLLESGAYIGKANSVASYLREAILEPDAFISSNCGGSPCQKGIMPASLGQGLTPQELEAVIQYLLQPAVGPVVEQAAVANPPLSEAPVLSDQDYNWAKLVYFERCAGCHATLRKGATGPALTPDKTRAVGTVGLSAIIFNGTSRGMPDWGKQGFFTKEQTDILATFLQMDPPTPPELPMERMTASWNVLIPPEERPTAPQTTRNWENYFLVTLRDAGQVAVIDGDTYEVVSNVDSGYAVHITRMSATGRYAYVIGRDGKLALIDLWTEKPTKVAEVQVCYDARSVEVSKYNGPDGDYTDKLAVVGCYWPPHFVVIDGQTLEPMSIVSTRGYTVDTKEYHPEPRVASIIASDFKPEWIINVKETGQIWLVNYTDPYAPLIKMLPAARFLHDGGWDSTHRYFMVAANQSNKVAVVDAQEGKMVALVDTPKIPHPG